MFAANRYETQDAMIELGRPANELVALAARAQVENRYLSWALEEPPEKEE